MSRDADPDDPALVRLGPHRQSDTAARPSDRTNSGAGSGSGTGTVPVRTKRAGAAAHGEPLWRRLLRKSLIPGRTEGSGATQPSTTDASHPDRHHRHRTRNRQQQGPGHQLAGSARAAAGEPAGVPETGSVEMELAQLAAALHASSAQVLDVAPQLMPDVRASGSEVIGGVGGTAPGPTSSPEGGGAPAAAPVVGPALGPATAGTDAAATAAAVPAAAAAPVGRDIAAADVPSSPTPQPAQPQLPPAAAGNAETQPQNAAGSSEQARPHIGPQPEGSVAQPQHPAADPPADGTAPAAIETRPRLSTPQLLSLARASFPALLHVPNPFRRTSHRSSAGSSRHKHHHHHRSRRCVCMFSCAVLQSVDVDGRGNRPSRLWNSSLWLHTGAGPALMHAQRSLGAAFRSPCLGNYGIDIM